MWCPVRRVLWYAGTAGYHNGAHHNRCDNNSGRTSDPPPVFTLGSRYLEDPGGYTLLTKNDTVIKEFRVDSPSWGIYFRVQPLNDIDPQSCWFVVNVTNVDTNFTESYGYGRDHPADREQWIPMYKEGPYKLTVVGNNVKIWLTAAKRMP